MKLLSVKTTGLYVQLNDGTKKTLKATPAVRKFAKDRLTKGEKFTAEFQAGKVTRIKPASSSKSSRSNSNGGGAPSDERSVLASVCTLLAGTEGVTTDNVVELLESLFAEGMELVKGKVTTADKEDDEEEEEFEEEEEEFEEEEEDEEEDDDD